MRETIARARPAGPLVAAALLGGLAMGCVEPNPFYETDPQLGALPRVGELTGDLGLSHVPVKAADASPVTPPPDAGPVDVSPPAPADAAPARDLAGGGKLCDPCQPQQPYCSEPGGLCLIVNDGPSFCTKPCARHGACPDGYECIKVDVVSGSADPDQCVPIDRSCE